MPGLERINRCGRLIEGARRDFLKYYLKKCPTLFHICYDPIGTHRKARAFIGFLFGFVAAVVLYEGIIVNLQFDTYTSISLGAILVAMLSIGCASSIQMRCICLLTIPTFLGRSGHNVLRALILGYVIAGPIFNLTYNGKEVVRTFACTTQLTYNLTQTRFDLMFKPFQQAVLAMKADANELKDTLSSVRDLMSPIVEEIEGEEEMRRLKEENDYLDELQDDTRRSDEIEEKHENEIANARSEADVYEAKYKRKIEARCEEQLSHGAERCRDMFGDAYDKCYDTVTIFAAWLLCWPMKLTFVCNLVQALGGSNICDPEGKVDAGIGEGYVALKRARDAFSKSLKDAKLQYRVRKMPVILDLHDATDAAQAVMHEFNSRRRVFESVMMIIKRCLSFVFLRIIVSAQTYHEKYLSEIEHDNVCVTSYFRKIDARRKARGSLTLLPLKKIERSKFVDPYSLRPGEVERVNLTGQTVKLILEMISVTTFILLDRLFFEALDLVRRHSHMEYTQAGHHDMTLEVRGIGVIASLIRSVIHGFNVKRRVKTVVSNSACLPRASRVPNYIILKIYLIYLAIWLLLLTTAYTQRLRRVICSFFYRKREKRRVLYLYNESLRRRLGHARFMRARIRTLVRTRRLEYDLDPWVALRLRWPALCGWLTIFAWARQKCLVCGEVEPRRGSQFHRCTTPGCPFVHCSECWDDIGRICYACADIGETDDDTDEFDTLVTK
ncbi:PREDICTED: DC-STAMP domain-containing protein 1-like [Vollenhovia emeryi]|uniref:DC-STAMP domain-containing protein 1-like n=1 Tax=Vollenhovia emeryi TaxID=411798 RepID=UPI0005F4590E|nr:PREDICTED: DC-STAMP domain-containing protein 1-like [Vollenhovia emeryi]